MTVMFSDALRREINFVSLGKRHRGILEQPKRKPIMMKRRQNVFSPRSFTVKTSTVRERIPFPGRFVKKNTARFGALASGSQVVEYIPPPKAGLPYMHVPVSSPHGDTSPSDESRNI